MQTHTLYELNEYLRRVIALNMGGAVWISCEIANIRKSGGHYYMEFVEKEEEQVIARADAVLWKGQYKELVAKLGHQLPGLLKVGIQILAKVKVSFHERYGFKLNVEDLDPAFTLGQMELKRREIINRLRREGLLERNAEIPLPIVLQRVAVISSETAAGWEDFRQHLSQNSSAYGVNMTLFPSRMQGQYLESDILKQLDAIKKRKKSYDVVVIIRGGGSKLDLAGFDSYELGKRIANFPLPVLTGIGHEIDETVPDLVACAALKTPTAVADSILDSFREFDAALYDIQTQIHAHTQNSLQAAEYRLNVLSQQFQFRTNNQIKQADQMLDFIQTRLTQLTNTCLRQAEQELKHLEHTCHILSPEFALKRGFSITLHKGKPVTDANKLKAGDQLETRLKNGKLISVVKKA